jgi:hypothetical protein
MKPPSVKELIRAKQKIERGTVAPANVWEVRADEKGGFTRRKLDPEEFRSAKRSECATK